MGFTSANSCCCFGLKTGGFFLGYLSLLWGVIVCFYASHLSVIGPNYLLWYSLVLLAVVVIWLYGVHANKYLFLLPYLIYSVIITTIICTGFVVISTAAALGYECIDYIYQQITSATSINFGMMRLHSPDLDDALSTGKSLASGVIFFIWFICASITAINWYYTIVMISLYKKMKAESLGQPLFPMVQNFQYTRFGNSAGYPQGFQIGNIGVYPQAPPTANFDVHPQVPQTNNFDAIQMTK